MKPRPAAKSANFLGRPRMKAFLFVAGLLAVSGLASAQSASSAAEIASYDGLHGGAHLGDLSTIRSLVAAGADLDELDGNGRTPVHVSAFANDPELVSLALHLGKRPHLIAASHLGHHEVVRRLIAGAAPLEHVNNLGWTALIEVASWATADPTSLKRCALWSRTRPTGLSSNVTTRLSRSCARARGGCCREFAGF